MSDKGQALLSQALTRAANAILITDRGGRIVWVNDAFCRLSGFDVAELLGQTPHIVHSGIQDRAFYLEMWETILIGQPWQGELVERRKDGSLYTVNQVITPLFSSDGDVTHFVAIQHDVSQRQADQGRMQRMAYHDGLTGLPNRTLFFELFNRAIEYAVKRKENLALMFLDLDRFKAVNDTLGHSIGDQLLNAVAERLTGAVRKADVVARLGGDEFIVLATRIGNISDIEPVAKQVLDAFSPPFTFGDYQVCVRISIGVSVFPLDGDNAEVLLRKADAAMYRVKAMGGNNYGFWTENE
ncbi:diguanylate cyclase domain-containing protein [Jeongeupia chitinilytica]|nr:diguanylate cyclase [Jeongeupia chitinilytica]